MIERRLDHCTYLLFEHLAAFPQVTHAVFTRRDGFSEAPFAGLNASFTTGDDPARVRRNKAAIEEALALPLVATKPVHGAAVEIIERDGAPHDARWVERLHGRLREIPADAMLTDVPGFALCWAFGDCAPVLLFDPEHNAIALAHAGWRGAAAGVVLKAVRAMRERYGTRPNALLAGVGPAIGSCCYEVNEAVRETFAREPEAAACAVFSEREGEAGTPHLFLDIGGSSEQQLLAAGIAPEHIILSGYCTGCRTDLFYSHRCEPWPSGRFAVAIGLGAKD